MYEFLVSDLKKELSSVININDDKEHESVENAHEAIDNNVDMIKERHNMEKMQNSYERRRVQGKCAAELINEKTKRKDEEVQKTMKEIRDKTCKGCESLSECDIDSSDEDSEHDIDSSDEDSEYDYGDCFGKMCDG